MQWISEMAVPLFFASESNRYIAKIILGPEAEELIL